MYLSSPCSSYAIPHHPLPQKDPAHEVNNQDPFTHRAQAEKRKGKNTHTVQWSSPRWLFAAKFLIHRYPLMV